MLCLFASVCVCFVSAFAMVGLMALLGHEEDGWLADLTRHCQVTDRY